MDQRVTLTPVHPAGVGPRQLIALLSMVMALAALGIDMMLPAFDEIRSTFGLDPSSNDVARMITAYFLGMALAPIPYGVLADRVGRRPVLWLSGGVYILGAVGAALAPTFGALLIARFVWGLGAAGGRVMAFAIVRDTQEGERMAKTMSYVMAVFILVPVLAPSLGALLVAIGPWRGVFWTAAVAAAAVLLWTTRLAETLAPDNRQPVGLASIASTALTMATTATTLVPVLALTAVMAVMSTYLASSELIVSDIFDRGAQFPIVFGATAAVLGVASLVNGRLLGRFGLRPILAGVSLLYLAGGLTALVMALATDGRPGFWLFMPALVLTIACQMLLTPNLNTMALAPMAAAAGTASAIVATTTTAGGALLGAVVDARISDTVTPLAVAVAISGCWVAGLVAWLARREQRQSLDSHGGIGVEGGIG